jgi:hypothetical protein
VLANTDLVGTGWKRPGGGISGGARAVTGKQKLATCPISPKGTAQIVNADDNGACWSSVS